MKRGYVLAAGFVVAVLAAVWLLTSPTTSDAAKPVPPMVDASAAVIVAPDRMIVADDEQNILRVYGPADSIKPLAEFDLGKVPGLSKKEMDIEGGALIGDRVFWIGSHGRSRTGVRRPERSMFFSTSVKVAGGTVTIEPKGAVCTTLVDAVLADDRYNGLGLEEATRLDTKKAPDLAPKKHGINIEGLTPMPDGKGLFIGLRNPRPQGKALVVPLLNPLEVIDDKAAPKLGDPILLALGGSGIRGMEWVPALETCLIIAGPPNGEGDFMLYRWTGKAGDAPVAQTKLTRSDFNPESLVQQSGGKRVQLISDDGWKKDPASAGKTAADVKPGHFTSAILDTATWQQAE